MTHRLRDRVAGELTGAVPPSALDTDRIVKAGRRRLGARRAGLAGGFALAVVALTGGILALQPAGGTAPVDAAAEGQPTYPLPGLDGDKQWTWKLDGLSNGGPTRTEATEEITDALWSWIESRDDLAVTRYDPAANSYVPVTRETFPGVVRDTQSLYEVADGTDTPQGYQRPVYRLGESVYGQEHDDLSWTFAENADANIMDDSLRLAFYPKGSFVYGAQSARRGDPAEPDVHNLVAGCDGYSYDAGEYAPRVGTFSCEESTGPNGERVVAVTWNETTGTTSHRTSRTVVLYRNDGNAVVVSDSAYTSSHDIDAVPADPRLVLSAEELTELAASMPDVVVE